MTTLTTSIGEIVRGTAVCAVLTPDEIDAALDPAHYLGSANTFVDRALRAFEILQPAQSRELSTSKGV